MIQKRVRNSKSVARKLDNRFGIPSRFATLFAKPVSHVSDQSMVSRTRSVIVAGGFIEGERDRTFEAVGPGDQYTDAAPKRVRGNPAFVRLSYVLSAGFNGRLDALPPDSGDSLAIENGQRHRIGSLCRPDGRRQRPLYRMAVRTFWLR